MISGVAALRFILVLIAQKKSSAIQYKILLLIAYLVTVTLLRSLSENNLIANLIAYIILGFHVYFFIFTYGNTNIKVLKEAYSLFEFFVYIQAFLIYISGIRYGFIPGDIHAGSTGSAHEVGFFLYIVIIKKSYDFLYLQRTFLKLFVLIYLGLAALLTDTNQFLLALGLGFGITNYLSLKSLINLRTMLLGLSVFGLFFYYLISTNLIHFLTNENYLTNEDFSPKLGGYLSLTKLYGDYPLYFVTGTGVGTYSSRAAVSLVSNQILGKDEKQTPFESNSYLLREYLAKYYTPAKFRGLSEAGVTGTFYTPVSEVLSLISEFGLIGLSLLLLVISELKSSFGILKHTNIVFYKILINLSIAYAVVCLYDNWLEHPEVIFPFLILMMIGLNAPSTINNTQIDVERK